LVIDIFKFHLVSRVQSHNTKVATAVENCKREKMLLKRILLMVLLSLCEAYQFGVHNFDLTEGNNQHALNVRRII
jgi:hypothetical protein